MTDPNDILLGSGVPSAKFPTIGTLVKGVVEFSEVNQQTDIKGEKKFYDDGNPMQQIVVTLMTDERDPEIDNDDGRRKLYVKGQMTKAIGDALRQAGARLEVGGTLAVKFEEEEAPKQKGYSPTKVYRAAYKAPAAAGNDLLGAPQAQDPAPEPTPAPQPEPAMANAGGVPVDDLL